jgi:hypothetical protein
MFIDSNATPRQLRSEERKAARPLIFKILSAPPNGAGGAGDSGAIDISPQNGVKTKAPPRSTCSPRPSVFQMDSFSWVSEPSVTF